MVAVLRWGGICALLLCLALIGEGTPRTADARPLLLRHAATRSGGLLPLDAQQAREVAVLVAFIYAYNTGHVAVAVSLFGDPAAWSDCDYRSGRPMVGRGRASLTRWLTQLAADHDRLTLDRVMVGGSQPQVLGVSFKSRVSDTLRALKHPRGIIPRRGAMVSFDHPPDPLLPSIVNFANGPGRGSAEACRLPR